MKKTMFAALWVVIFLGTSIHAQDSICYFESEPQTCIEYRESSTVEVSYETELFGNGIAFCPNEWDADTVSGVAQVILCIDRSGSMDDTDPDTMVVEVANNFLDKLDSIANASGRAEDFVVGVVLYSANGDDQYYRGYPNPIGDQASPWGPKTLDSPANLDSLIQYVSYAGDRGWNTPYGAALDSCLVMFNGMPDLEDAQRSIVFLSDGEPWAATDGDDFEQYQDFLTSGGLDSLGCPIHTVYFYTASNESQKARDTLVSLADTSNSRGYGAGTFNDVDDPSGLYAAFDSILQRVAPTSTTQRLRDFRLINVTTGDTAEGIVTDTSVNNPYVEFPPFHLDEGMNTIQYGYVKLVETGDSLYDSLVTQTMYVNRLAQGQTPTEDSIFNKYCDLVSSTEFMDAGWSAMANGAQYSAAIDSIRIQVIRGPDTNIVQTDTVLLETASGDQEYLILTETGASTATYRTSIFRSPPATAVTMDGILQINPLYDTLYMTYRNPSYYASGEYWDVSRDTIVLNLFEDVNNLAMFTAAGDPASLPASDSCPTPPDTILISADDTLTLYGKAYGDVTGKWLGSAGNLDTIDMQWTISGFTDISSVPAGPSMRFYQHDIPAGTMSGSIICRHVGSGERDTVNIVVMVGDTTSVRVETSSDGSGSIVDTLSIGESGTPVTGYAVGRDQWNNYIGPVTCNWISLHTGVAVISSTTPNTLGEISGVTPGLATIQASYGTLTDQFFVLIASREVGSIVLYDAAGNPSSLTPLKSPPDTILLTCDDTLMIYAKAFSKEGGVWLGSGGGQDSIPVSWDTTGFPDTDLPFSLSSTNMRFYVHDLHNAQQISGQVIATFSGAEVYRDTINLIVIPGDTASVEISTANDNSGEEADTLTIYQSGDPVNGYSVCRDQWGNFIGPAVAVWQSDNTAMAEITGANPSSATVISKAAGANGNVTVRAVLGSFEDEVTVKIVNWRPVDVRIVNSSGTPFTGTQDLSTSDSLLMRLQLQRSDNSEWVEATGEWQIEGAEDVELKPGAGNSLILRELMFRPVNQPATSGIIYARLLGYSFVDTVAVSVTPQLPIRYGLTFIDMDSVSNEGRLTATAGETLLVKITAYNDDGRYLGDLTAEPVRWISSLASSQQNLAGGYPQMIMGNSGSHDTLGHDTADLYCDFIDGICFTRVVFYNADSGQAVLTAFGSRGIVDTSNGLTVYPASIGLLDIQDTTEHVSITADTVYNNGQEPLYAFSRGYDLYGNYIGNVSATWAATGSLVPLTTEQTGPRSDLTYSPIGAAGGQSGYITAEYSGVRDSVFIYIAYDNIGRIALYTKPGDPANLSPADACPSPPDTILIRTVDTLSLYAKAFGLKYGTRWLGNAAGIDTIPVEWTVVGFTDITNVPDSASMEFYQHFIPLDSSDQFTGMIIASRGSYSDTVVVSVVRGPTVTMTIETAPGGAAADDPDTLQFYADQNTITLYAVGWDQYGNFTGNLGAAWQSLSPVAIVLPPQTGTSASITKNLSSGICQIYASWSSLSDDIWLELLPYSIVGIRIVDESGNEFESDSLATNDSLTMRVQGLRDDDSTWINNVVAVWTLQGLDDRRNNSLTSSRFVFRPVPSTGTGIMYASLLNSPQYVDSVRLTVTLEPPSYFTLAVMQINGSDTVIVDEVTAGDTILLKIEARNSNGLYPADITWDMYFNSSQQSSPFNFSAGFTQQIIGDNGAGVLSKDTVGLTVNFETGVDYIQMVFYNADSGEAVITALHGSYTDSTYPIRILDGPIDRLEIERTSLRDTFSVITLYNDGTRNMVAFSRGYDAYGNYISTIRSWWTAEGDIPEISVQQSSRATDNLDYQPLQAPNRDVEGIITVYDSSSSLSDTVAVYILNHRQSEITYAVTRDTNGNGYLDMIELHYSQELFITCDSCDAPGVADISSGVDTAFTVYLSRLSRELKAVSVYPAGVYTNTLYLVLQENNDADLRIRENKIYPVLETGEKPEITYNGWSQMSGVRAGDVARGEYIVDGAGPVVWYGVINDRRTPERSDDYVTAYWSEPIKDPQTKPLANDAFKVWYRTGGEDSLLTDYLEGCDTVNQIRDSIIFTMKNDKRITTLHKISIDSIRGEIQDLRANYALLDNRHAPLAWSEVKFIDDFYLYPNPLVVRDLVSERQQPSFTFRVYDNCYAEIRIYDMAGGLVRIIPEHYYYSMTPEGSRGRNYEVPWNGMNGNGRFISAGGYIAKMYAYTDDGKKATFYFKIGVRY